MTTTVLAPDDRGVIKCRECGKVFAAWERSGVGRERSGWVMLRAHVNQYHHDLNHAVNAGVAAWFAENAAILNEGVTPSGRVGGGDDW